MCVLFRCTSVDRSSICIVDPPNKGSSRFCCQKKSAFLPPIKTYLSLGEGMHFYPAPCQQASQCVSPVGKPTNPDLAGSRLAS